MPISLRCPHCGKGYRLRDGLGGKRVRCPCGTVLTVPGQLPEAAGNSTQRPAKADRDGQAAAGPPRETSEDGSPSGPTPAMPRPRKRRRQDRSRNQWRKVVGVLCIVYGSAMAPLMLVGGLPTQPFDFTKGLLGAFLAGVIVVGGVLILTRHPYGPACAGLSCVFLCFFRVWIALLALLSTLSTGKLKESALIVLSLAVFYSIPVVITIWCLRQEAAKKADSRFPL